MEQEDEVKFIDAEQYMGTTQAPLTYEMIVLNQLQRCVNEGSKEMIGGYIKHKQTSKGLVEEYIPDQRQIYIQSIMSLYDVLLLKFDNEMNKANEEFKKALKELGDEFQKIMQGKANIATGMDALMLKYNANSGYMDVNSVEFKAYMDEKIKIYRWLFQNLVRLVGRKSFLQADYIDDEHYK